MSNMGYRFTLRFRDVEDLLAARGVTVSYEAVRLWCRKFGPTYAHNLRRRQGQPGDVWHLAAVFIRIRGERYYLWRAVNPGGDVLVTRRRDARAAKRFFCKPCRGRVDRHGNWSRTNWEAMRPPAETPG